MLSSLSNSLFTRFLSSLLFIYFSVAVTTLRAQTPEPQQRASVRGTVVNSVTRQPIGHAQVYSYDNRIAAMTDDQGHFEVPVPHVDSPGGVSAGIATISLTARKPGYLSDQKSNVNVLMAENAGDLTISLVPEAILMGHLTLSSGDSAEEIQVQLFRRQVADGLARWVPQNVAMTDSSGEFRFADLQAGDYRVGTHEAGDPDAEDAVPGGKLFSYPPVYFPEASDFPGAASIHLMPGKVFDASISLTRKQYFPVKIAVNNGGAPGTPINVNVSVQGDGAPGYSLGYIPGDQTIRGFLPNGIYMVEAFSFAPPTANGTFILRVSNGPSQEGQLTMLHHGSIEVRVKEEFAQPGEAENPQSVFRFGKSNTRHGHVYLGVSLEPVSDFRQVAGRSLRPPQGPSDESLGIDDVPPGRYWVRVTSGKGYAAEITSGGVDLQHAPLVVGTGGSSPPIEITMRDDTASFDGLIEGTSARVQNSASLTPAAYVYCIPQPESPGQFTQVWVGPDGNFKSPEMQPGVYRVLAFQHEQNDLEYRNPEAMRAYESKGQVVRLVGGQKEHLQLQVISRAEDDGN